MKSVVMCIMFAVLRLSASTRCVRVLCLACEYSSVCACVCMCSYVCVSQLEQKHKKTDCVKAVPSIFATVPLHLHTSSVKIITYKLSGSLVSHCPVRLLFS